MVPDQLYISKGPGSCESASSASVEVVSSSNEMSKYEASSISGGYDQSTDVTVSAGPVEPSTTVGTKMMMGSSNSAAEYESAAKKGETRSAFATITSTNYDVYLLDEMSLSPMFKDAILRLEDDSSDDKMRDFFFKVSQ